MIYLWDSLSHSPVWTTDVGEQVRVFPYICFHKRSKIHACDNLR